MKKAAVLCSGGLDSTTCLAWAIEHYGKDNVIALSVYYGQRHSKELEASKAVAEYYGLADKSYSFDLSEIFANSSCALLKHSKNEVPEESYAEQMAKGSKRVSTYVPFRNGLMLSTAASFADSIFPGEQVDIIYGAHADDVAVAAYADCSIQFVQAMSKAIAEGTYNKIRVVAPFVEHTKAAIVKYGLAHKVPYQLTWSCYEGHDKPCGKCGTCLDRLEAFRVNGVEDPVEYEQSN